jgi:uroporphyrinogen decarboxylase
MYERAWTLTGMENLLVYMVSEPGFVERLLDKILEYNLKIINIYLDYDVDCIHFGDDWGQQKGLIMGPVMWRRFIKPRMAEMYGAAKAKGRFVSQHSCGDIREVLPDVIDIGLDVYQTFQPEIYDIRATKEAFGDRLTFWGGISTQRLLPFETPGGVIEKAAEIMRIVGKNGGLIAAPTHSIPGDVPAENMDALIRLFTNQDKYI